MIAAMTAGKREKRAHAMVQTESVMVAGLISSLPVSSFVWLTNPVSHEAAGDSSSEFLRHGSGGEDESR